MILTCPSCSKRFMLDAALLGQGRRVKCGHCAAIWFQDPPAPDHPAHPSAMSPPKAPAATPPSALPAPDDDVGDFDFEGGSSFSRLLDDTPPVMDEEEEEERARPRLFRPPARPEDVKPRRWKAALPWAGLAAAVLLVGAGLVQGRDPIVHAWPAANGFYELVGVPVEPPGTGLDTAVTAEYRDVEGNPMLFVSGEVRNVSDTVREVPDIVATALGSDGRPVQSWLIVPSARRLFPNQSASFSSIQPEGQGQAKEVSLAFQPQPAD